MHPDEPVVVQIPRGADVLMQAYLFYVLRLLAHRLSEASFLPNRIGSAPPFPTGNDIDSQGRFADFHALLHTFITNLARADVSPKTANRSPGIATSGRRWTSTHTLIEKSRRPRSGRCRVLICSRQELNEAGPSVSAGLFCFLGGDSGVFITT